MAEDNNSSEKRQNAQQQQPRGTFIERLVRKTLSSVGGVFEKPFHSDDENRLPSTSDLTERLKHLIDAGVREQQDGSRVAPHLIRLKHTWGETTDEFEENIKRLKNELLVVAIDHINDNRYRTIAPVKLEVKPDILAEGLTLAVGFDASDVAEAEKVEVPAEIFAGLLPKDPNQEQPKPTEIEVALSAEFPSGANKEIKLHFIPDGKSNLTIGRNKENDIFLDDNSVSKQHASLVMSKEGALRVADVGSTNGTYLEKERISYGKAYEIKLETMVVFGEVKCRFDWDFSSFEKSNVQESVDENESAENDEDSGEPETVFASEPETVFSKEPETVFSKELETAIRGSVDEPETVRKSSDEPETVFSNPKKDSE